MVVMTAKVSKTKLIAVICILIAVICVAVVLLSGGKDTQEDAAVQTEGVTTNESRIKFLESFGWEVEEQPVETQEIMIPEEMNEVFEKYNELQKSQGFDLTKYAGRQAKRYVYAVENFDGATEPVYATLLIYRGTIIGGDVTSTAGAGLMQGFARQSSAKASS